MWRVRAHLERHHRRPPRAARMGSRPDPSSGARRRPIQSMCRSRSPSVAPPTPPAPVVRATPVRGVRPRLRPARRRVPALRVPADRRAALGTPAAGPRARARRCGSRSFWPGGGHFYARRQRTSGAILTAVALVSPAARAIVIGPVARRCSSGSGSRSTRRSTSAAPRCVLADPATAELQRQRRRLARHEVRAGGDDLAARREEAVARLLGRASRSACSPAGRPAGRPRTAIRPSLIASSTSGVRSNVPIFTRAARPPSFLASSAAAEPPVPRPSTPSALRRSISAASFGAATLRSSTSSANTRDRPPRLAHRAARTPRSGSSSALLPSLLVDADRVAHAGRGEPLAGLAAPPAPRAGRRGRARRARATGRLPELIETTGMPARTARRIAGATAGVGDRDHEPVGLGSRPPGRSARSCASTRERVGRLVGDRDVHLARGGVDAVADDRPERARRPGRG